MPMTFPGENSITLNEQTLHQLLRLALGNLGMAGARITRLELRSYPTRLFVDFTSDPASAAPVADESDQASSLASDTLQAKA